MSAHSHDNGHPIAWDEHGAFWRYEDTGERAGGGYPCAHCGREPVPVAVVVPADQSHTGETRVAVVPIDACIADLVRRLNAGATEPVTCGACCGHGRGPGEILLADGRRLEVLR